ncbi:MAG: hypothetical protein HKL79_03815 [Thermoplasmata archaeon]|nr:hypothetical protein [Thermoplasmata archaeon]
MVDGFAAMRRNHRGVTEIAGLGGFGTGLGGIMFEDAPLALIGFGIAALATTDVAVPWAFVTVPTGLILIFVAVAVYLIR